MCFYQEIENWAHNNCNICGWFESYRDSWKAHKNSQLFKKGIWNERFGENKILS